MDLENFRAYCLSLPAVTEDFPFDETTLCFRVGGKIFAISDVEAPQFSVNLKCDPEKAIELRERFECVKPGWHMNKKLWNTITPDATIEDDLVLELARHSYELIFQSLKKSIREEIERGL
ncbi:MAG: MmcQ/YjbR family DNA-binding protein [Candidatus Kapaibacterium sp.]